jgi:diguanylate cyclase (GGDEF)-like protein
VSRIWRRIFSPVSDDVRFELVDALFRTSVPIAISGILLVLILLHSMAAVGGPVTLALCAAGVIVAVGRLLLNRAYLRSDTALVTRPAADLWERRYTVGCFAFSALIGITGALAFHSGTPSHQLLATALVFGYAAGAVCRISIRPAMCVPALMLAAVPPIVAASMRLELDYLFYGGILLAFLLGSIETVRFLYDMSVEQISMKHEFASMARHDALTGLANRVGFKERLKRTAVRTLGDGDMIAVHNIDLDRFKEANDRYGHPVGDALLQAVASRLSGMLRENDFAVRLGGDEFVVVQSAVGHPQEALLLARRAIAALNEPFAIDGHEITIGACVGIAIGRSFEDVETLMSAADKALYASKTTGRNRATFAHLAAAPLELAV